VKILPRIPIHSWIPTSRRRRQRIAWQKSKFENQTERHGSPFPITYKFDPDLANQDFMSMEEFTRYRERTSLALRGAYQSLCQEPRESQVTTTGEVESAISRAECRKMNSYVRWIVHLYAGEMISRFGGLNIVEKGMLPTGMVDMFRESRFKWQD
jgi:hypothetical protein